MSAVSYSYWRAERFENAVGVLFALEGLAIPIWYDDTADILRIGRKQTDLTIQLQQYLAEYRAELVELLRWRVAN